MFKNNAKSSFRFKTVHLPIFDIDTFKPKIKMPFKKFTFLLFKYVGGQSPAPEILLINTQIVLHKNLKKIISSFFTGRKGFVKVFPIDHGRTLFIHDSQRPIHLAQL